MKIKITLDSVVSPSYLNLLVTTEKRSEELSRDRRYQKLTGKIGMFAKLQNRTQHYMFVESISLMRNHMKQQILTAFQQ